MKAVPQSDEDVELGIRLWSGRLGRRLDFRAQLMRASTPLSGFCASVLFGKCVTEKAIWAARRPSTECQVDGGDRSLAYAPMSV